MTDTWHWMRAIVSLYSARLYIYCVVVVVVMEAPSWPVLSMMTHGSCDRPWLICSLREDNANQTGRRPAWLRPSAIADVARQDGWLKTVLTIPYRHSGVHAVELGVQRYGSLITAKSYVQQRLFNSVTAAPVSASPFVFTCAGMARFVSSAHHAAPLRHCCWCWCRCYPALPRPTRCYGAPTFC